MKMDRHHSFRDASEMENSVALTRAIPRPRSLCDNKLLSVHQVNGHVTDRPPVPPHRNGQPPQRPPPVPTRPPRSVEMPTKFRGSWPYAMTPTWNTADPDLTPYPPPLSSADKAPSMAGLLNTTVPQRLVVTRPIRGGQHTPTRHSLRHSRMISLSQQGRVPRKYLPPVIHHHRLGTALVLIQLLLGALLLALALYFLLWSPQLNIRDVPHWSAVSLMISGFFGIFLICCCRKPYPGMRRSCCVFAVRVQYIACNVFLAMVASAACLCACVFASLHADQLLFGLECDSNATLWSEDGSRSWNSSCICRTVMSAPSGSASIPAATQVYTYDPLTCYQVQNVLPVYLISSAVANGTAVVVCIWYILLLWSSRYAYTYAGLKVAEQKAAAMASLY